MLLLSGCARSSQRIAASRPAPSLRREWLDLEPGWRIRVVTPLLRSGGYVLKDPAVDESKPFTFTVTGGEDFLGRETALYAVKPRGSGARVVLESVELSVDGKTETAKQPREPLFRIPKPATHVRILHLTRASRTSHDAAILAADSEEALNALTRQVQSNAAACRPGERMHCGWIPRGIAVIPEARQRDPAGSETWMPL